MRNYVQLVINCNMYIQSIIIFFQLYSYLFFFLFRSSDDVLVHFLVGLLTIDSCQIALALVVPDVDEVAVCCVCLSPAVVDPDGALEGHRSITRHAMVAFVVESGRVGWNPEVSARSKESFSSDR